MHTNEGSPAGSQGSSNRGESQPLHRTALTLSQKPQDSKQQPYHTWGLTHEAQYFADLDAEELVEDGQEAAEAASSQPAVPSQSQQAAAGHRQGSMQPPKQQGIGSDCSSHMQTPDAIALAKYHPGLQVCLHNCTHTKECHKLAGQMFVRQQAAVCVLPETVAEYGTLAIGSVPIAQRPCPMPKDLTLCLPNCPLLRVLHQFLLHFGSCTAVCLDVCIQTESVCLSACSQLCFKGALAPSCW